MSGFYAYDKTNNRLARLEVIDSVIDTNGEVVGKLLAQVDVAASNLAKETGGNLAAAATDLDTIATNTTGIATQATLADIEGDVDTLVTNTTGLATQATLADIEGDIDTITANLNQLATSDSLTIANIPTFIPGMSNNAAGAERLHSMSGLGDSLTFAALANAPWLYNGTNWDRQRNNQDNIIVLASAARTTTQTQADQTNYNHRGIQVVLDMTAVGTGSVTLQIDAKDPVSGKYIALLTGAAVVTNVTNIYTVYPGITVAANVSASQVLPRTWRIKVTANNANSATYSVGAMLLV